MANGIRLPDRALVSQANQSRIAPSRVPRSRFVGRRDVISAYTQGQIYPFHIDEIMPGDHMRYNTTVLVRMSTLLFPMFSRIRCDVHWFFVPMRILWTNFKRFMGEQPTPASGINFTIPQLVSPAAGFAQFGLADHFGIPVNGQIAAGETISVNALPFRAYNLIWNDWYRDENQQDSVTVQLDDGPDVSANYVIRPRNKMHDYFTTVLPWPQKFTAPSVPLGTSAPVIGLGTKVAGIADGTTWRETVADVAYPFIAGSIGMRVTDASGTARPMVYADLSASTGISINTLRQAWLIQSLLERDARGGTRYTEIVRSHFDVVSPDARLQRPEYIGGGSTDVNVTPIAQTATGGGGLGALGGAATAAGRNGASFAATEHGYILGLISFRAEESYQQGLHPLWRRFTRTDMPWPELAGLGEQAVRMEEIYCTGLNSNDDATFGYQERYGELRYMFSNVTGIMRSTATGTLDMWHLSKRYTSQPVLGDTWIRDTAPMTRVLAAGAAAVNQQFIADIVIERDAVRPLPMFGTPISLGRF